jgi:hypothetical protein
MRHGPTRAWLTPWRKRCRCGCAWYPCPDAVTVERPGDPLWHVAERVADCIAERGYAFVEDDKVGALAAALRSFLMAAGVPVNAGEIEGAEAGSRDRGQMDLDSLHEGRWRGQS